MKNITIVVLAMLALLCSAYAQECIHITAVQDSTERTPFSTCEGRNCSHTGTAYWVHHNRAYKATIDNRMFTLEESSVWHRPHSDLEVGHDYRSWCWESSRLRQWRSKKTQTRTAKSTHGN